VSSTKAKVSSKVQRQRCLVRYKGKRSGVAAQLLHTVSKLHIAHANIELYTM